MTSLTSQLVNYCNPWFYVIVIYWINWNESVQSVQNVQSVKAVQSVPFTQHSVQLKSQISVNHWQHYYICRQYVLYCDFFDIKNLGFLKIWYQKALVVAFFN